ncbi:helix-turn-helix domain-containing protein [Prevotella pectinovora]|jgi:AraC family transcriptional regulator, transcriptional activator of pobA|uniref:helix-turn-helix domain-containing protein n=2 Tax=Prevotella TaxID=838 RepID=UPI00265B1E46|nr:helix-turn-helix domain-containing protein [uncultured Prevotella sp.]
MATFDKIDTTDIRQLTNSEFVDYADNDVVIIDDLRNFSKLQTIKLDFLLIIVVTSGRVAMKAGKVDSTASCNDIIICQPNTILNECLFSIDFTAKAVCLSAKVARKMLHISDVLDLSFYLKNKPIIHVDKPTMSTFEKYHTLLSEQLLKEDSKYKKQIVGYLVSSFLFCLLSIIEQTNPERTTMHISRSSVLFKQFVELLNSLEVKPRRVDYYSSRLCITTKYLSNICKENSGKTAYEWIVESAVEDINRLLSHSDMSIKEISNYLEFPNLSFFGRFVRAHLGCSPTEYRRRRDIKVEASQRGNQDKENTR